MADSMAPLLESNLTGIKLLGRGKVRDNYDLGEALLIVSSDRISAFDHVLPNGIPDKGRVLNQISLFWFERLAGLVRNHLREHRVERFPEPLRRHADILRGRAVVVTRLEMLPIECVVRGYLAGSGYKEYRTSGSVCGIKLPAGLKESSRLPEPIFTPSTKATAGHDENIPFSRVVDLVGRETAEAVRQLSLTLYGRACEHAESRGILIADTKLEFGRDRDGLVLADEVLTPDSSRFWPADEYRPGGAQPSFDKQYVRDYLESIGWDKNPPAPALPGKIVEGTRQRYLEIFRRLTGRELE
ncbi:MAG TPA: phosphoribosylaminoimidazolesuccinocarboxamide synthase [Candidatus Polarisedimenticolia bacterium]|nr:phosphoribosylaminoimidazolesuccinocarboxamide synthase [Candidatus Polarisedimenticolia bacterium]